MLLLRSKIDTNKILELIETSKLPYSRIARLVGCSRQYVHQVAKKQNVFKMKKSRKEQKEEERYLKKLEFTIEAFEEIVNAVAPYGFKVEPIRSDDISKGR